MLSLVKDAPPELPAVERVRNELARWPGIVLEAGLMRGSTEFHHQGRLLGSIYPVAGGDPAADLIFPPAIGDALIAQRRAQRHALVPLPGWVTVRLASEADIENAISLFRENYQRHGRPLRAL